MTKAKSNILLERIYLIKGGDFLKAGEASSSIKKILKEIGIDNEIIRRVSIASFEAEINIVCYAKIGVLYLLITPETLTVVAEDVGQGIENIELAMQEGFSTASDAIREMGFGAGMGLPNIKKNVDTLTIDSTVGKGTKLEMIVRTKPLSKT